MKIEYEATFININKEEIRQKLKEAGASLLKPEFLQKRITFDLPSGHEKKGAWLRVRDEGDKNTLTLKIIDGERIEDQKEISLLIDSIDEASELLAVMGCRKKAYQESRRELWLLDNVKITIDEWPYLEPYVEVEGISEQLVKDASVKLGFDYSQALFCSVDKLYEMKYGVAREIICQNTERITFSDPNPFISL